MSDKPFTVEDYGGQVYGYVNGQQVTVSTLTPTNSTNLHCGLGCRADGTFGAKAYFDELRIVKTVAPYKGQSFTVPDAPYL